MKKTTAHAVADVSKGVAVVTVEVAASPDRAFVALASDEVTRWWVRPGVFDTREWRGDVRRGGRWRASGVGGGRPYVLEGEFTDVDPPHRLVHTWRLAGRESTVAYELEPIEGGTRITLQHRGLMPPRLFAATRSGWEASFEELARILAP